MFHPVEILSLAGSVLLQMSLFLLCTVCASLIKISAVSWPHEEGRTPVQMRQTPSLSHPSSPDLYLSESTTPPIILLVWVSWFKADFSPPPPPCTHILPTLSSIYSLSECVCGCANGPYALRQRYITMTTL